MFRNWGFLLGEVWVLLLLAALLGLLAGWLIWSRREVNISGDLEARDRRIAELERDLQRGKQDLAASQSNLIDYQATVSGLKKDLAACRASKVATTPMPVAASIAPAAPSAAAAEPVVADAPLRLDGPRNGVADDLKRIRGIGPQMEQVCNKLGFYHFDQLASWTDAEVAWVDQNLEGFQGRVVRDQWVEQAHALSQGEETDFSKRVDKGEIPSSQ